MINEKYIELMHKEIDEVITPDEKIKLYNFLAENKSAKDFYDELILTAGYLDKIPDSNPSENLKKQIINSINFNRYLPKVKSKKSWNFLLGFKFRYAYTFAAGLFAGIVIYFLFSLNSNSINTKDISGTMGVTDNIKIVEEIPLNFSDISGKIELKERGNNFWCEIKTVSKQKIDLLISYPNQIKFENLNPESVSNIELSKSKNHIKITNSGFQQYSLKFSQNSPTLSAIHIQIIQTGNTVYEHELSLKR
jgi:hypothetical protein